MADLIDKRDAVDEVARFRGYIDDDMIYRIQWAIRRLPTIEAEKSVHRKWLIRAYSHGLNCECNGCGCIVHERGYSYCPNCGAIMDA